MTSSSIQVAPLDTLQSFMVTNSSLASPAPRHQLVYISEQLFRNPNITAKTKLPFGDKAELCSWSKLKSKIYEQFNKMLPDPACSDWTMESVFLSACVAVLGVKRILCMESWFPVIKGVNVDGNEILQLKQMVSVHSHSRLFTADLLGDSSNESEQVVAKIYEKGNEGDSRSVEFEMSIYERLGNPLPIIPIQCFILGKPLMLMSPLEAIDPEIDDEHDIGAEIIDQLYKLHAFTVHSDIKPDNIMASRSSDGTRKYHLIDFGGCAQERLPNGFMRRRVWSADWCCQERYNTPGKIQQTCFRHDLLELGKTLTHLQRQRKPKKTTLGRRLAKFMEFVDQLRDIPARPVRRLYDHMISILSGDLPLGH